MRVQTLYNLSLNSGKSTRGHSKILYSFVEVYRENESNAEETGTNSGKKVTKKKSVLLWSEVKGRRSELGSIRADGLGLGLYGCRKRVAGEKSPQQFPVLKRIDREKGPMNVKREYSAERAKNL